MRYKLFCPQCGREFTAMRRDTKRCSSNCRVHAFRGIPPAAPDNDQRCWLNGPAGPPEATAHKQGHQQIATSSRTFAELSPWEILRLSDAELRDYCDRFDAVKKGEAGKVNGSQAAAPVTETGAPFVTGEAKPILREPVKPLEGAPLHMLNDYYAAKKRWNEQQRGQ